MACRVATGILLLAGARGGSPITGRWEGGGEVGSFAPKLQNNIRATLSFSNFSRIFEVGKVCDDQVNPLYPVFGFTFEIGSLRSARNPRCGAGGGGPRPPGPSPAPREFLSCARALFPSTHPYFSKDFSFFDFFLTRRSPNSNLRITEADHNL